jgi:hypothetical protein
MNLILGKAHLIVLDILIELRGWLDDNIQMQAPHCPTATGSLRLTVSKPLMHCCTSCVINQPRAM